MKKSTKKQELQFSKFKDLAFDDFKDFVGKIDLLSTLEKNYKESSLKAKEKLQALWRDNLNTPIKFNAEYLTKIRQCYFELAEADIAWQSCNKDVGQYLGVGVNLSKVVKKINDLYDFIQKRSNRDQYEEQAQ